VNSPSVDKTSSIRVAVVGGGLAGLAAAVAAREQGFAVELLEARGYLGGRAGSFQDPQSGQRIDHCQHVAMGCCTNLADFCRRTGIADCFRRDRQLWFIGPDGTANPFAASPWLPCPLHLALGLMGLDYLGLGDRLRIASALVRLARVRGEAESTIGEWLQQQGQSQAAIERFWSVVLVSALGETLDRASLEAARKVFVDGFLASRGAYELEVPRVSLGEIYDERLARWLVEHGVRLRLRTPVRSIKGNRAGATSLVLSDGEVREFDYLIIAVPWRTITRLPSDELRRALPNLAGVESIHPAPITAVHLWLDRPVMQLPHAVLVGRLSQWVFSRGDGAGDAGEHYYQVVISASRDLKGRKRDDIVHQVCSELAAVWPAFPAARLLRWRVVTNPEAVFSVRPELDRLRPAQHTAVPNLFLAGDWTATGWPATMEGAVRSGYLAVEALLRALGTPRQITVPDLPRSWLARRLIGRRKDTTVSNERHR
jgi:squalene-associated FAD-dependent desaturase